jgi:hypothetical protein
MSHRMSHRTHYDVIILIMSHSRHKNGQMYGLTKDALEAVAIEEKAALTHMNLDGIRSMKLTQLQPRYVLIIPKNENNYKNMIKV